MLRARSPIQASTTCYRKRLGQKSACCHPMLILMVLIAVRMNDFLSSKHWLHEVTYPCIAVQHNALTRNHAPVTKEPKRSASQNHLNAHGVSMPQDALRPLPRTLSWILDGARTLEIKRGLHEPRSSSASLQHAAGQSYCLRG